LIGRPALMNSSYRMSAEWVAGSVELKDCSECYA
jgi:hypothetical protein